jgi:hypothetical protein
MTISATASSNGKTRRSLAAELDRFDHMLDGLADGLNEAIGEAVKVSVDGHLRETIGAVVTELFTNPEIVAKLRTVLATMPTAVPPAPTPTPMRRGLGQRLRRICSAICHGLRRSNRQQVAHDLAFSPANRHCLRVWAGRGRDDLVRRSVGSGSGQRYRRVHDGARGTGRFVVLAHVPQDSILHVPKQICWVND